MKYLPLLAFSSHALCQPELVQLEYRITNGNPALGGAAALLPLARQCGRLPERWRGGVARSFPFPTAGHVPPFPTGM